jgi:hypothetical protein
MTDTVHHADLARSMAIDNALHRSRSWGTVGHTGYGSGVWGHGSGYGGYGSGVWGHGSGSFGGHSGYWGPRPRYEQVDREPTLWERASQLITV